MLVDFWAEWCGPCKRFGPIYEKTSEEYPSIVFAKLDTDANQELSGQLGIEGIPTLMAFREGVLVFNQAGALPGPALKQVVQAVKGLDMVEVHAQVAKLQAEHAPTDRSRRTGLRPLRSPSSTTSIRGQGHPPRRPASWATGRRSTMVWPRPIPLRLTRTGNVPVTEQLRIRQVDQRPGVADQPDIVVARPVRPRAAPVQQLARQV